MNRTARSLAPLLLAAALLLVGLAATACAGSGADDGGSNNSGSSASMAEPAAGDAAVARDSLNGDIAAAPSAAADESAKEEPADSDPITTVGFSRAVIREGNVALSASDVTHAQIEVRKVVDRYAGEVTDEETQTDGGKQAYTRMVLRIPTDDFDKAMAALRKVDTLESVSSNEKDVTAQVIDVQTRVQAQRRSIARITVLFDQARNIRDIMAIESELSRRQADLDALERKQAQLASQTSMSTIVVSIEPASMAKKAKHGHDDTGFLAGLASGWDGLQKFFTVLATIIGALLPWTIVVALVGVPTYLLVRALRRRTPPAVPEAPAEVQASE